MDDKYPDLTRALEAIHAKADAVETRHKYLTGTQEDVYDPHKWRETFGPHVKQPRDNVCEAVARAKSDLMVINGFAAVDDEDAEKLAEAIWKRNRGPVLSNRANFKAVGLGSQYLMLGTDSKGDPIWSPQDPRACVVLYDEFDETQEYLFAKTWHIRNTSTLWVRLDYTDGTFDKFSIPSRKGALPKTSAGFQLVESGTTGFPALLAVELEHEGSDIDVMLSLQDQVNLSMADLRLISHTAGFPTTVLSGVTMNGQKRIDLPALSELLASAAQLSPPADANASGEAKLESGPGKVWTLESAAAKATQLAAADLAGPLALLESTRAEIPIVTGRPAHLFGTGQAPSGVALWESRTKLRASARRARDTIGVGYAKAMELSVWLRRSHNEDGTMKDNIDPADRPVFEVQWEPEEEAPLTLAERVAILVDLNVPAEYVLREELKVPGDELEGLVKALEEKEAEAQAQFDRGLQLADEQP